MGSSRARRLSLLAVLAGLAVDVGGTQLVARYLPEVLRAALAATGTPPGEVEARLARVFARHGTTIGVGLGWLCSFLGGFLTASLAGRARVEHALVTGALSAVTGVPIVVGRFLAEGPTARFWLDVQAVVRTVPMAALGGGVRTLLSRLRRRPAAPPADPALAEPGLLVPPEPVWAATGARALGAGSAGIGGGRPAAAHVHPMSFHGTGGALFGIHIVNVLLTLLTVGIYRFWARVRVRRFLYGHTEFEGDRIAFHGTGRETFVGWLKAMAYVGLPLAGLRVLEQLVDSISALLTLKLAGAAAAAFVVPVAIAGAWRYRLSRTEWRGIRFSFRGRARTAIAVVLSSLLLTVLSLGLYLPAMQVNIHRFLVEDAYFGTGRFGFDGEGGDLVGRFLLFLLLAAPAAAAAIALAPFTFGLSLAAGALVVAVLWFDYSARRQRYVMAHTTFREARFRSTVTGRGLLGLHLGNLLLVVLTLGLAAPWAYVRSMRYALGHLAVEGPLDVETVVQDARAAAATGEGIADMMDADAFDLGVGV